MAASQLLHCVIAVPSLISLACCDAALLVLLSDFMVYETLKLWLPQRPWARNVDDGEPRQHALLACGAIAGVVGQTVAYPLDLVRRRLQVQGWSKEVHYEYKGGILRTMKQIVDEEGVRGLYRGMIPNYYKGQRSLPLHHHTPQLILQHTLPAQMIRFEPLRRSSSCFGCCMCMCSGARCVDLVCGVRGHEEVAGFVVRKTECTTGAGSSD